MSRRHKERDEVYDRLYAEFPRLYQSQRKMFRRLNGRPL
jgi:hypothetical protein